MRRTRLQKLQKEIDTAMLLWYNNLAFQIHNKGKAVSS